MTSYTLCRARIESTRLSKSINLFLCRIIPDMEEIKEVALLPEYPAFLFDESKAYSPTDIVWCLVSSDFQLGYIIGLCENPLGRSISSFVDKINDLEAKFSLEKSKFSDLNLSIIDNCFIDFSNAKTRTSGRISNSGVVVLYGGDGSINLLALNSSIKQDAQGNTTHTNKSEKHEIDGTFAIKAASFTEKVSSKKTQIFQSSNKYIGGDETKTVLGGSQVAYTKDSSVLYVAKKKEVIGLGSDTSIGMGGAKLRIGVGDYSITTIAGGVRIQGGLGVSITAGAGGVQITSATVMNLTAPVMTLAAPVMTLKPNLLTVASVGLVVPSYVPGPFCALPICPLTGLPHSGSIFAGV